jgi:hypothetical protein
MKRLIYLCARVSFFAADSSARWDTNGSFFRILTMAPRSAHFLIQQLNGDVILRKKVIALEGPHNTANFTI